MQNAKIKMKNENYYKKLRNKFLPKNLKTIFLMESPPSSGKYFYDETGNTNESLFSAMMGVLSIKTPQTKRRGLEEFAKKGYFLVDATHVPVNDIRNPRKRDDKILENYDKLVVDLHEIIGNEDVRIILVQKNICRLFQIRKPLRKEGFDIVNNGETIPFPSHHWQREFDQKIRKFL